MRLRSLRSVALFVYKSVPTCTICAKLIRNLFLELVPSERYSKQRRGDGQLVYYSGTTDLRLLALNLPLTHFKMECLLVVVESTECRIQFKCLPIF